MFRKAKHRLMAYNERQLRAEVAEEIAQEIMAHVIGPGAYCKDPCPDWVRYRQAKVAAWVAREIGNGRRPGRIQAAEPGCSPSMQTQWLPVR